MNKVVGVHDQNKASKQIQKTKKKQQAGPVKVVYISNPMKVNASASQFRALVQQLTGRDAHDLPEHSDEEEEANNNKKEVKVVLAREKKDEEVLLHKQDQDQEEEEQAGSTTPSSHLVKGSSDLLISFQDITGYFSPSNFWYESVFHVDASKVV